MAVPDFQTIMLPLLRIAEDGKEHYVHDAVEVLSNLFELTDEERAERISSGSQTTITYRTFWARTYLKKAQLLQDPRRGYFQITQRGLDLLKENPDKITTALLMRYPEFVEFRKKTPRKTANIVSESEQTATPEEEMEQAYQQLRQSLADEILQEVIKTSPVFFERLVVNLLFSMGYGGTQRELARAVGRHGDEGIDGVIDQDKLGLDTIYIQAKNWQAESSVGRPELQKFVGALIGQHDRRGVFITTARFSQAARDYVKNIDAKVILIDGERLANLMIDYGVGVSLSTTYEIKTVDHDFFTDEVN